MGQLEHRKAKAATTGDQGKLLQQRELRGEVLQECYSKQGSLALQYALVDVTQADIASWRRKTF
jgi:hypothetical protein